MCLDRDPLTPEGVHFTREHFSAVMLLHGLANKAKPTLISSHGQTVFQLFHNERGQIDRALAGVAQLH